MIHNSCQNPLVFFLESLKKIEQQRYGKTGHFIYCDINILQLAGFINLRDVNRKHY